jgi:membrane protease YdiL (CAAX protease family)
MQGRKTIQSVTTKQVVRGCVAIIVALLMGFGILIAAPKIPIPSTIHPSIPLVILFVCLNVALGRVLNLGAELREYWSLKKIVYLPVLVLAGAAIGNFPAVLYILAGKSPVHAVKLAADFSIPSFCITLMIVVWEEAWFRGIFLNYSIRYLSAVKISLIIGLLFMLMHALNPAINMLQKGPALFMAGALLTMVYFQFKTIWASIGLHLGNNYFGSMIVTRVEDNAFWGGDGYVSAFVLFVCFLALVTKHRNSLRRPEVVA